MTRISCFSLSQINFKSCISQRLRPGASIRDCLLASPVIELHFRYSAVFPFKTCLKFLCTLSPVMGYELNWALCFYSQSVLKQHCASSCFLKEMSDWWLSRWLLSGVAGHYTAFSVAECSVGMFAFQMMYKCHVCARHFVFQTGCMSHFEQWWQSSKLNTESMCSWWTACV